MATVVLREIVQRSLVRNPSPLPQFSPATLTAPLSLQPGLLGWTGEELRMLGEK